MLTADPCRPDQCLAEDWLGFLGHRWNALTLWQLESGPRRFSDLQDRLPGISPKVLTERLEGLQARGLVSRQVSNGFPRTVTYALTVQGAGLRGVLMHLYDWAETLPVMGAENTNAAL